MWQIQPDISEDEKEPVRNQIRPRKANEEKTAYLKREGPKAGRRRIKKQQHPLQPKK